MDHCYYQGQVRRVPSSVVAVSMCHGIRYTLNKLLLSVAVWTAGSGEAPYGPGATPPYPFTSQLPPSSTLSLTFHLFTFSLSYSLYLFCYFSIPSLSTRIGTLRFQARGRRRRSNLGLVFFVLKVG